MSDISEKFLRSVRYSPPLPTHREERQKLKTLRKVYHRAVQISLRDVRAPWQKHLENSTTSPLKSQTSPPKTWRPAPLIAHTLPTQFSSIGRNSSSRAPNIQRQQTWPGRQWKGRRGTHFGIEGRENPVLVARIQAVWYSRAILSKAGVNLVSVAARIVEQGLELFWARRRVCAAVRWPAHLQQSVFLLHPHCQ